MISNGKKKIVSLCIPTLKNNVHQRTFLTGMACTNEARTNVQQIINNILPSIVNSIQCCDVNCQYCHLHLYIPSSKAKSHSLCIFVGGIHKERRPQYSY